MARIVCNMIEVFIFSNGKRGPRFLILKRAPGETLYPGLWQFVTGSIRRGERAPDAARRELMEETGLKPERLWIVPHIGSFYDAAADRLNFMAQFAARVPEGSLPRLSSEHCDFGWHGWKKAEGMLVWPGQKEGLRIVRDYILRPSPHITRLM